MVIKIESVPKTELKKDMTEIEKQTVLVYQVRLLMEYIDDIIIQVKKSDMRTIRVIDNRE